MFGFFRKKKSLNIIITLSGHPTPSDFNLRYMLVDTIEERKIGQVWNEGTGEGFMEVNLDLYATSKADREIKSILQSLGILERSKMIYSEIEE